MGAPAANTLLDSPAEKPADRLEPFSMFIDGLGDGGCLKATDDATMLKVVEVSGGPIGLWNNRPHTLKVKKDDLVVKLRKAGPNAGEWIGNDAVLMLGTLQTVGPFEMVMKRPTSEAQPESPSQSLPVIKEENDPAAKETEAPAKTGSADPAVETPPAPEATKDVAAKDTKDKADGAIA